MQIAIKFFALTNPPPEPAVPNSIYLIKPVGVDTVAVYKTDPDGMLQTILDPVLIAAAIQAGISAIGVDLADIAEIDPSTAGVIASDGGGWIHKTYSQLKTALGLGSVDNTPDNSKPVSTAQAAAVAAAIVTANAYADSLVVGLLDDRGNYDASGNTFPASGGSGASGAIKKGDLWTVSVGGTLATRVVTAGDVLRALVDAPGQTSANWAITENNFGYVAENAANKDATGGYAGLTLFKINFRNALNTFTSFFTNSNTAARTYTFQDRNGTIADDTDLATKVGLTDTATLTNKRITQRVVAVTQHATPSYNTDNGDVFRITGLAQAITNMSTNKTGTPVHGDRIIFEFTDDGTGRAIAWGTGFEASGTIALPTTTTANVMLTAAFRYNSTTSKFRIAGVS
jgi:hypothetical protein